MSKVDSVTQWRSAGSSTADKRLLLISAHYPPDPAVGSLRWMHFTRYLADERWAVDVVSGWNPVTEKNGGLMASLPANVRVFSVKPRPSRFADLILGAWRLIRPKPARLTPRPAGASRGVAPQPAPLAGTGRSWKQSVRRALLSLVEYRTQASWSAAAVEQVDDIIQGGVAYNAVVSSGPPHSAHVAAHIISRRYRLPHLVDLRDPWSLVERVPEQIESPLWFRLARRDERRVFEAAGIIALNTERSCRAYRNAYPRLAARMVTIRNGSDDDPIPTGQPHHDFRIRFGGSIYLDRDPRLLFRAASRVISTLGLSPKDLKIEFMGTVDWTGGEGALRECAEEEGVGAFFSIFPPSSRSQAFEFFANADLLVSLPQDSHMAIPAKIYEYVRFSVELLVLAEPESATSDLLAESRAHVIAPADVEGMTALLVRLLSDRKGGQAPLAVGVNGDFDRRRQGNILVERLASLVRP
jgi:hypothetical protein